MIELLGVGILDAQGEWRLRRGCAVLERGAMTAVVARFPADGAALLDAITGRRIPEEGRVWAAGVPLMRETKRRVRRLVREVGVDGPFVTHRSLLWNTLVARGTVLAGLLRFPRPAEREAALRALGAVGLARRLRDPVVALSPAERGALAVARALARHPAAVLLRDADALGEEARAAVLGTLRRVAQSQRLVAIASLRTPAHAGDADRVLHVVDGRLVVAAPWPPGERGATSRGRVLTG